VYTTPKGTPIELLGILKGINNSDINLYEEGKGKGEAIQLQAWTGPEGSRRLRLPDFKTIST
jgi:hypothetical protein